MEEQNYRQELYEAQKRVQEQAEIIRELRETKWSYESDEIIRNKKFDRVLPSIQIASVLTLFLYLLFAIISKRFDVLSYIHAYIYIASLIGTGCTVYLISYLLLTRKIGKKRK